MKRLFKQLGWLLGVIIAVSVFSLLFTGIIQTIMEAVATQNGNTISESTLYGVSGTIGFGLAAIVIWLIIRYAKRLRFYHCPNPANTVWSVVFILFILAICRVVLPGIWAYTSYVFGGETGPVGNAPDEPIWQMILFGVILAPILEELLFRKDIFSLLKMRFSLGWTIGLSALLFAAIHGYNAEGFVSCLVAGILFSILMARTGKLLPCVTAHILCNLESFYYNTTKLSNPLIVNLNGHTTYNAYIFAAGFIVAIVCGAYIWRNVSKMQIAAGETAR